MIAVGVLLAGSLAAVASSMSYTIVYGDTLSELAERFGSDVDTLAELNGIENPDLIIAGDQVQVPTEDDAPAADQSTGTGAGRNANTTWYTVQDGDTLSAIASEFGVTVEELVALNNLDNVDLIVTGEQLKIDETDPAQWAGEADESASEAGDAAAAPESGASEEAGGSADDGAATEPEGEGDEAPADETTTDEATSGEQESGDAAAESDTGTTQPDAQTPAGGGAGAVDPLDYQLHLVLPGETLKIIAEQYGLAEAQLLAANWHAKNGVSVGMILKVPPADMSGVRLVGVPAAVGQWPVSSEVAAAALATTYWGSAVTVEELLAAIPASENPHDGFRGAFDGMWGPTDDYGVYAGPLAAALESFGFAAEAFYADGDAAALAARIDAGAPVVVWVTYQLKPQERVVVENESGRYSLVAEQHALLVYGYDDTGILVVDVSDGLYHRLPWDAFMAAWNLFDGMGLAITPIAE
jgi:LysM repeat protein